MRRMLIAMAVVAVSFGVGISSVAAPVAASKLIAARGQVVCSARGTVTFTPGLKTASASVATTVAAKLTCTTGTTGAGGVTVVGGTLSATVSSARLSCATTSLPRTHATVHWNSTGGSVKPTKLNWSAGTLHVGSAAGFDFPGSGTAVAKRSYAGTQAALHIVADTATGSACSAKKGWKGFSFTGTRGTSALLASSAAQPVCGNAGAHPNRYSSVVVFAFENRTWSDVGGAGFGSSMPYLHSLAQQCAYFTDWTETDTAQNSLTQYIGQTTGARQAGTVNDCSPSATCSTTADNIFRQARSAGITAIDYVEGATKPCSAAGNAARHVPDLYMWSAADRAACTAQVRPYSEFNPNQLPNFAFVTPTLCNDGHDCGNSTVDSWAQKNIAPVLSSAAYKAGHVAVFVWYDEDHPVPNVWVTPTAAPGGHSLSGAGYAGTLSAWESMLGLPCLANACNAPAMRTAANS